MTDRLIPASCPRTASAGMGNQTHPTIWAWECAQPCNGGSELSAPVHPILQSEHAPGTSHRSTAAGAQPPRPGAEHLPGELNSAFCMSLSCRHLLDCFDPIHVVILLQRAA